jgi:hypothetical protein
MLILSLYVALPCLLTAQSMNMVNPVAIMVDELLEASQAEAINSAFIFSTDARGQANNSDLLIEKLEAADTIVSGALAIAIDGKFEEWQNSETTYSDPANDGSGIDLLSMAVANDSENLYIKFELAEDMLLNSGNELYLEIDGDNNAATGYAVNGIGAELGWKFGSRTGYFNTSGSTQIGHDNIRFVAAPTVTSNVYEIAIARNVQPIFQTFLFTSDTIRICLVDQSAGGDYLPDPGYTYSYIFDDSIIAAPDPVELNKADPMHIRLMTYNVLQGGLSDPGRVDAFGRIISSMKPDIITFNECWNVEFYEAQDFLNNYLPLQAPEVWTCWKIDGANITCSRFPFIDNWQLLSDRRLAASLIDLPTHYLKDFLVINAHFKCCDGDSIRQREADGFASFILDAKSTGGVIDLAEGTPFVLSGDLNLVGENQQLRTLITGDIQDTLQFGNPQALDWDGSNLNDIVSYITDKRIAYTWRNDGSSYWPGRLDFHIASDVNLDVEKYFSLETAHMSTARLAQYSLQASDCAVASDHLPKITDFSIPYLIGSKEKEEMYFDIYPNPSGRRFKANVPSDGNIEILNVDGQLIHNSDVKKGNNEINLNMEKALAGTYIVVFKSGDDLIRKKLIIR